MEQEGPERAHFLIKQLIDQAYRQGSRIPYTQSTPYINTIPPEEETCLLYTSPSPRDS